MQLLLFSLVLMLALLAIHIAQKSGIPSLLLFLALGIAFKAAGMHFDDYQLADTVASLSLMVIIFYGGFTTNWNMAKAAAWPAITLASAGVVLTAAATGFFAFYVLRFELWEALLLGSVVGSTDFASVSSILVSNNLNLKYNTVPLLEIESGSNDPTAFTLIMVCLAILLKQDISIPLLVFKQVFFGITLGFLMGWFCMAIIRRFHLAEDGLFIVFIAAAMFGTYAICNVLGGNGYLALYILGIYLGNKEFIHKKNVIFFYDGMSSLVEIALFFLLGLLSEPAKIVQFIPVGFLVMAFMLLIARPVSIFALLSVFKTRLNQNILISLAGIRGAAAIAFAIMAVNSGAPLAIDLFHIVFVICLFSLFLQGFLMPWATKVLDMYDPSDTVLNTFNYYQFKSPFKFIQLRVKPQSPWCNKTITEIDPQANMIFVKVLRDESGADDESGEKTTSAEPAAEKLTDTVSIVPSGDTRIYAGDVLVVGGEGFFDHSGEELEEIRVDSQHPWVSRQIKELALPAEQLIVMIQRANHDLIIPDGNTRLKADDRVVLLSQF